MAIINQPPQQTAVDRAGQVSPEWATWFSSAFTVLGSVVSSGTTARRPTTALWVGRTYFDTTLGIPIWYSGSAWVKADGTPA